MIKVDLSKNYLRHIQLCMLVIFTLMNSSIVLASPVQKITFWNVQQKGANIFNRSVTSDDIKAAKKYGIKFIRLAPDKFASLHRDFLIGNADDYRGLIKEDLAKLKQTLDICHQEGIPVVITMLSLPGSRWKQNNQDKDDLRIWKKEKYQAQAALFWQDLAAELKDHPAIVGYNLLNEPHPERIFAPQEVHINTVNQEEVQKTLYDLYSRIIKHIRLIDKDTPIILDSSAYANPQTFQSLIPHEDKNILYSFHMYEPYEYTNYKTSKGKLEYPGRINGKQWDQKALEEYMAAVVRFQKTHKITNNRILVGEFGGHRMSAGLEKYFEDLIVIFNKEGWHFAFYAFREDTWDGMDYELGSEKLSWTYWQAVESGRKPDLKRKATYPAFSIIQKDLK
ncbi:MAG: cellulase family glycosylhydrolase [Rickettsiaceae bacterium]